MTVSSPVRTWNARMDTEPVARVISPGSIAAIRNMGTKIRRFCISSTTTPSAREG